MADFNRPRPRYSYLRLPPGGQSNQRYFPYLRPPVFQHVPRQRRQQYSTNQRHYWVDPRRESEQHWRRPTAISYSPEPSESEIHQPIHTPRATWHLPEPRDLVDESRFERYRTFHSDSDDESEDDLAQPFSPTDPQSLLESAHTPQYEYPHQQNQSLFQQHSDLPYPEQTYQPLIIPSYPYPMSSGQPNYPAASEEFHPSNTQNRFTSLYPYCTYYPPDYNQTNVESYMPYNPSYPREQEDNSGPCNLSNSRANQNYEERSHNSTETGSSDQHTRKQNFTYVTRKISFPNTTHSRSMSVSYRTASLVEPSLQFTPESTEERVEVSPPPINTDEIQMYSPSMESQFQDVHHQFQFSRHRSDGCIDTQHIGINTDEQEPETSYRNFFYQ